jgi:nicotinamide-nucleotide amidase
LGDRLCTRHLRIATAESCTGGGIAAAITAVPGSSAWFEYGVVSYANTAKEKLLDVPAELLVREGAVSEAVVIAMARGILELSKADIGVAVSGIAGPSGGSVEKPVGTVWFAWMTNAGKIISSRQQFAGDRAAIQEQAVMHALEGALKVI